MATIIWSPEAITDLQEISEYISANSYVYAEQVIESIIARTDILLTHPHTGRLVPESEVDYYREVFQYRYRIIYSIQMLPDIRIMRVFHMARSVKSL